MIVKNPNLGFLGLLLEMRGSIVPAILPHIICSALLGVVACLLTETNYLHPTAAEALKLEFGPFTALGVAISLFLGFHNNASYSRWWEARILWGRQIIVTRNIARFLLAVLDEDDDALKVNNQILEDDSNLIEKQFKCTEQLDEECQQDHETNFLPFDDLSINEDNKEVIQGWRQNIVRLSCAHTHAFRYQMRPNCAMDGRNTALRDRNRFLSDTEQRHLLKCRNPANSILFMASKILGKAHKSNMIDTYSMIHTQNLIDGLCEIQTAAERIHNTSLPLAYSLLVYRTSFLYVLLVPFAIVEAVGWWTPVFTAIVAYTFFGLAQLAKEIQDPFKDRPMCLALSAMSRTIEVDVLEVLGKEAPGYLKPKYTILM